ncbi:N-acetyltransferase [Porticoccus sp. W117]|uniref:GNAT family N-acetyltransferase n=1 Tax=Porticoccus sp. W117 TaxID=3054777 RepID=UPI002592CCF6|nr:N-acetyltransferase [Porticoccus sp. W117]MDM3870527.1 N-acetyltransferase [Porticoccus sp. W117]
MVSIRPARDTDRDSLVAFNCAMALETEGKTLNSDVVAAGVSTLLQRPELGFYLIAEEGGEALASLMVTSEWSDWRNGLYWWVQSVYVRPEHRRRGIYRQLYQAVQQLASEQGDVCGFRLYVEKDNVRAQQTYRALGMSETVYQMYEQCPPARK